MNQQVNSHIEKYPVEIREMFLKIRQIIRDSVPGEPEEKMWAGLPSYYIGEAFVRLIPFKDHINIEAKSAGEHREELVGYKFTPKGMVQIFVKQEIPVHLLEKIFVETFAG